MTFLFTLLSFIAVITLMSIGIIFSRPPIKGSCGGLAQLDIKKECNCVDMCVEHSRVLYQIKEPYQDS
ncbi:(Na+)-NQR maturation NqrM [Vibrio kagoshimensis]|uniref:(Na+)-NQR maturation NqrM n=1 Tax=Vibrio kagoshimensis TaxID=2910244 RepID=UPI003D1A16B7